MRDVQDWQHLFSEFHVVERGHEGSEFDDQHELLVNAASYGLARKVSLLRGDIDRVVLAGRDDFGKPIAYPFDVVTFDYSGGILYRDNNNQMSRLQALARIIREQGRSSYPWLLFLSLRIDAPLNGEVKRALEDIRTELKRYGKNADAVIGAILDHDRDEIRLKVFVPYFVNQVAARCNSRCVTEKTIIYNGNHPARMMNFRFFVRPDSQSVTPRFPQERLVQIINAPLLQIRSGVKSETTLGLPKLRTLAKGD
jgi:hypothetical protein